MKKLLALTAFAFIMIPQLAEACRAVPRPGMFIPHNFRKPQHGGWRATAVQPIGQCRYRVFINQRQFYTFHCNNHGCWAVTGLSRI